jgi:hypothetical protein
MKKDKNDERDTMLSLWKCVCVKMMKEKKKKRKITLQAQVSKKQIF